MVVYTLDRNDKIGIFDSGLGGISVLNTLKSLLPNESYIYIGDSLHAPYGTKSKEEVFQLSKDICDQLIKMGVKAIVIACNTATSAAVSRLRDMYDIPIIGMEPAVKPALRSSEGQVVVIATEMTLKEEKFIKLVEGLDDGYRVEKLPAPEWVDCVENHLHDVPFVQNCVNDFLEKHIPKASTIVLGCTHYIFLKDYIRQFYHDQIDIYDGNVGTALQLKNTLESMDLIIDAQTQLQPSIQILNTKSESYVEKAYNLLTKMERRL